MMQLLCHFFSWHDANPLLLFLFEHFLLFTATHFAIPLVHSNAFPLLWVKMQWLNPFVTSLQHFLWFDLTCFATFSQLIMQFLLLLPLFQWCNSNATSSHSPFPLTHCDLFAASAVWHFLSFDVTHLPLPLVWFLFDMIWAHLPLPLIQQCKNHIRVCFGHDKPAASFFAEVQE